MILQALVNYYDALAEEGKIARPGWGIAKVSYALELDESGDLIGVHSLKVPAAKGKKMVAREMLVPAPGKRTVGIASNFLCDNSAYILGFDGKGNPKRARECFEDAKELHLCVLKNPESVSARAVCNFFSNWNPETASEHELLMDAIEDLKAGANLLFLYDGEFVHTDAAISSLWQSYYDGGGGTTENQMRCLVTVV